MIMGVLVLEDAITKGALTSVTSDGADESFLGTKGAV